MARSLRICIAGLWLASLSCPAQQTVQVPSLHAPSATPVVLPGHWFAAPVTAAAPAMVLLHGCGGTFDRRGALGERYAEMARRLNQLGVHVLVTDSFTPRGEKELCTQAVSARRVTQLERRGDALGALQWLARQPGVDAGRLGLLGWSHGGTTVLSALNRRRPDVAAAAVLPSLAVAFYPGCEGELIRGFQAAAPLLMLLGESDDWTPAAPCKALAQAEQAGPAVQWQAYAGAHHGFDGTAPVRLWRGVPGGANPGQGVHVGAEPVARAAAAARLQQFLQDHWRLRP